MQSTMDSAQARTAIDVPEVQVSVLEPGTAARFWAKVDRSGGPYACWPYKRDAGRGKYHAFYIRGKQKTIPAHQVAVVLDGRNIPKGMQIDHLCRNPPCCNPAHLEVVTPSENVLRGLANRPRKAKAPKHSTHYRQSATLAAIYAAGGIAAVSRLCGICATAIQLWCRQGYVPDLRCGLLLATAAGIDPAMLAESKEEPCER